MASSAATASSCQPCVEAEPHLGVANPLALEASLLDGAPRSAARQEASEPGPELHRARLIVPARASWRAVVDEHALGRHALAAVLSDLELDLETRAAPLEPLAVRKAGAFDVEPLAVAGGDISVVLLLVEPQHLAAH